MVSDRFSSLNRVARQRLVYEALREELAGPVHALALSLASPAERPTESPAESIAG